MNWNPAVGPTTFEFCEALVGNKSDKQAGSDIEPADLGINMPPEEEKLLMDALTHENVRFGLFGYAKYVREVVNVFSFELRVLTLN
ncbi:MAG TPA: hypothetical protein VGO47_08140 [Chlamydiales bacterium]|jgi:hypothetical protein|nr:hypothetical protein [Chlamydiales bacterium]